MRTPYPLTTPLAILDSLNNQMNYGLEYDFTHASTSNISPGLSLDTNFPIFDSSLYGAYLLLVCASSIDQQGETGYNF